MTRPLRFKIDHKFARQNYHKARQAAHRVHLAEQELIQILYVIERKKLYVRLGYKSLRPYCTESLKFSLTQSQRIVTAVRRYEPTSKIGIEEY